MTRVGSLCTGYEPFIIAEGWREEKEIRFVPASVLAEVYDWLVSELGYPFDMCTVTRPPWLDVGALAQAWARRDGETAEVYRDAILAETGWQR